MKKLLGLSKKEKEPEAPPPPAPIRATTSERSGMSAPPPPPGSSNSSRNLRVQEAESASPAAPEGDFPPRNVLEAKLREFYMDHEPKKALELDKIITAAYKNGLQWLQDGLARKYNGATVDFSTPVGGAKKQPPPPAPVQQQPSQRAMMMPPVPVFARKEEAVDDTDANETSDSQPSPAAPSHAQPMFISAQPPPQYANQGGGGGGVVYPNAATALKSKGLVKYVKQLEERGILTYEDLAKIEENPNDPLWATMPPLPDKKQMRILIQSVREHVASLTSSDQPAVSPSSAGAAATPFDDHPELVEQSTTNSNLPQQGAFVLPPPARALPAGTSGRRPSQAPPPVPPPKPAAMKPVEPEEPEEVEQEAEVDQQEEDGAGAQQEDDAEEERRREEEEAQEQQQQADEEERQRREEEERQESVRRKKEQEEKRRMEEDNQLKRKPSAAASSAVAKPPPPPAQSLKRVESESNTRELEEAERMVSSLKSEMDEQTTKCDEITTRWERLSRELDEAQAQAEREKERLEDINRKFAEAKAKLETLRTKASTKSRTVAVAEPPPALMQKHASSDNPFDDEPAVVAASLPRTGSSEAVKKPPPPMERAGSSTKLPRSNSNRGEEMNVGLPRTGSQRSVEPPSAEESTEGATESYATSGHNQGEIAQEASHAKLRSTNAPGAAARQKSETPCDHFDLDMRASVFGMCMCGHLKADHKLGGGASTFAKESSGKFKHLEKPKEPAKPVAAPAPPPPAAVEERAPPPAEIVRIVDGQYPALEPCESFAADPNKPNLCLCGHQKTHHKLASPQGGSVATELSGAVRKPAPPARRPSVQTASSRSLLVEQKSDPVPGVVAEPAAPSKSSSESSEPPSEREKHRIKLVAFYTKYNPEKVGEVDTILDKFKGKEAAMYKKLKEKYPEADL